MVISIIDDRELWDRTVDQSPYGLLFHKWDFLKIVEKHTGWKLLPYGVYKGEKLLSLFPLFYKKDLLVKTVFSPPPLSCIPYLGPTMNAGFLTSKASTRESDLQQVVDEVSAEIRKMSPSFVYALLPPMYNDVRPFKWNGFTETSRYTYFIDLDQPLEHILKGFDKNLRWTLKKVSELPLELRRTYDTGTFCKIVGNRYSEQGLTFPFAGPGYLDELLKAYQDNLRMYFLYHGEEIASVITVCIYKGRLIYWLGNPRLDSGIAGNDFMLWSCIKMAKGEGCTEFELQGAGERRLWHFKSKYNPRLEICYAISKKNELGKVAEWAYFNIKRKKWTAHA